MNIFKYSLSLLCLAITLATMPTNLEAMKGQASATEEKHTLTADDQCPICRSAFNESSIAPEALPHYESS